MVNALFRSFAWFYSRILHRLKLVGKENLPAEGAFILAVNHISFRDPLVIASFLKWDACALAKKEVYESKLIGWIIRGVHSIPVDRDSGDISALRACLAFLKGGHGLVIFPEGHRYHDGQIHELKSGTAFVALRANVPLIPARIHTSYLPFAKITVNVGAPLEKTTLTGSQALSDINDRLRKAMEKL